MGEVAVKIIDQWGMLGLVFVVLVAVVITLVYVIRSNKKDKKDESALIKISERLSSIVTDIAETNSNVGILKHDITMLTRRVDGLEEEVRSTPKSVINEIVTKQDEDRASHRRDLINQVSIAPKIHKILGAYRDRINCDHIFMGQFHNGSSSLSGIPYYKFDIIAEKFKPGSNTADVSFAAHYHNVNLLEHNLLPIMLIQNGYVYYRINNDENDDMLDIDEVLYRRMVGRGIKQFAMNIITDKEGNPTGFIGCIDFSFDELNFKELQNCVKEIESLY